MCFKYCTCFLSFFFNIYVHTFFLIGSYGEVYQADMNGTVSSLIPIHTFWNIIVIDRIGKISVLSYSD